MVFRTGYPGSFGGNEVVDPHVNVVARVPKKLLAQIQKVGR